MTRKFFLHSNNPLIIAKTSHSPAVEDFKTQIRGIGGPNAPGSFQNQQHQFSVCQESLRNLPGSLLVCLLLDWGRKILKGADFSSSQEIRPDTEEIVEPRHPISFY
jgi:hypothetical protein